MSGSPKFSEAEIAEWKQKILEADRQRRAEIEARRRAAAEEQERKRQLEQSRYQNHVRLETILSDLRWNWANLYVQEALALQYRASNQREAIASSESEMQMLAISEELERIERALQESLTRKRRAEAEKKRQFDIERQQFELEELERRVAQTPDAEAIKFDAAGREQVLRVLETVREAIATGNAMAVRRPLSEAMALVQKHVRQIIQGQTDFKNIQVQANRQLAELQVMIAGLKADPVVMRWQEKAVIELDAQMNVAQAAIAEGGFEQVISDLSERRNISQKIIETANAAQKGAERRDYIAESIAQTLQDMGFSITFHQPEHPDHPASATILGAATQTGKGISVSVPIAGEVFYDVDGYVKHSVATVEGNAAAVCDEAEQAIADMHAVLEDKFGVKMGELLWQGKDPKRVLQQADRLPKAARFLRKAALTRNRSL